MQLSKILNPTNWFSTPVKKHLFNFSSANSYRNDPQWFQKGYPMPHGQSALEVSSVYACIKIISEETAKLKLEHLKETPAGGYEKDRSSAPYRVLRNPNSYQTRSDFILYLMLNLLLHGNAYNVAVRDRRGAVSKFHPVPANACTPHVVEGTGEIFYHFSTFDLATGDLEQGVFVPQRDVLHNRLFTPTHPLIGQTPLVAAAMSMASHQAINAQTSEFFSNMSRPDGLLTTPKPLNKEAGKRLADVWKARAAGFTPILDNDIKYQQLTMSAVDAEVVAQFNLSKMQIANIFRIPMDMLGDTTTTKYNNVEQFQKRFISSTLGFYLEHLEAAFDKFFNLTPEEHINFDLESGMMRPDFGERMEALSKGVTGAILTPNEARLRENLPPIEGGEDAYLQRQNWPLGMLGDDAEPAGTEPAPADPAPEPDDQQQSMTVVEIKDYFKARRA